MFLPQVPFVILTGSSGLPTTVTVVFQVYPGDCLIIIQILFMVIHLLDIKETARLAICNRLLNICRGVASAFIILKPAKHNKKWRIKRYLT